MLILSSSYKKVIDYERDARMHVRLPSQGGTREQQEAYRQLELGDKIIGEWDATAGPGRVYICNWIDHFRIDGQPFSASLDGVLDFTKPHDYSQLVVAIAYGPATDQNFYTKADLVRKIRRSKNEADKSHHHELRQLAQQQNEPTDPNESWIGKLWKKPKVERRKPTTLAGGRAKRLTELHRASVHGQLGEKYQKLIALEEQYWVPNSVVLDRHSLSWALEHHPIPNALIRKAHSVMHNRPGVNGQPTLMLPTVDLENASVKEYAHWGSFLEFIQAHPARLNFGGHHPPWHVTPGRVTLHIPSQSTPMVAHPRYRQNASGTYLPAQRRA